MKEKEFRNKIYWLTFLFSLLVIWIHSYNAVLYLGNTDVASRVDRLERFFGDELGQIAVPGFFMVSSYLFFRSYDQNKLWRKWNSRIKSVLVPYIMWNILYYIGYVVGSRLPVIKNIIGKGQIPFTLTAVIDAVLHYTYNYVFWYLYQLILLILLAPLLYIVIKRAWTGIIFLFVILVAIYMGKSLPQLNLDALFYYSTAAFAAIHGKKVVEESWNKERSLTGALILLLGLTIRSVDFPGGGFGEMAASTVIFRLTVPAALWIMISEEKLPDATEWIKNNFFMYAVHFAMVRLINKTGALLLPSVSIIPVILFLLMPVCVVFLSDRMGRFLRKRMPAAWILLNGGR